MTSDWATWWVQQYHAHRLSRSKQQDFHISHHHHRKRFLPALRASVRTRVPIALQGNLRAV